MKHNGGSDCWFGYRYIYPIKGVPKGSWVCAQASGTAVLSAGYASWGPVLT
jgi:Zn-finger protein